MIQQGIQMGVQAAMGAKKAHSEHTKRQSAHQAASAARRYVILQDPDALNFAGRPYDARQLDSMLAIPEVHLAMSRASECNMPPGRLSELLAITSAAQATLLRAVATAKEAQAAAGFKSGSGVSNIALGGIRGGMPLVSFVALGFKLDAQSCRAALRKMQEAEGLLASYWQQLQVVIVASGGVVAFTVPRQPLALSSILHALEPGSTASLASCEHPIIQALNWNLSQKMLAKANASAAENSHKNHHKHNKRGRHGKDDKKDDGGPLTLLRDGLKFARRSNTGMSKEQLADREPAIAMAAGACDADLLEFGRLTEQTEILQRWLQA